MTQEQKKMKRYVNAVERRLNLPRDVRVRVMSDFTTTIAALREAGRGDEEIYAELGTPQKAAAVLNEQMKEFAYRKSPWRYAALAAAGLCGLLLAFQAGINLLAGLMAGSVVESTGIIGGADGPTAIFLATSSGINWDYVVLMSGLILGLWGFWRLGRCKQKL